MSDFGFYFRLGWEHIMSLDALDHLLFVWVLSVSYLLRDWKQVLVLVTAFTIGHSLTLALSTFRVIELRSAWTEFLIPCTIVLTAASNVVRRDFSRQRLQANYALALFFGLIHGLGFANALRFMLVEGQSLGWGLFGFNLGLEAGQILVVAIVLLLSWLLVEQLRVPRRDWVLFVSAAVFGLALKMALERFP
ncbi:HupE/UreJ family protein [Flaviaesturariibacter terrae]